MEATEIKPILLKFAPAWKRILSYVIDVTILMTILSLLYVQSFSRQAAAVSDPQVEWSVFPQSYQDAFKPLYEKMDVRQKAMFSIILHNRNLISVINLIVYAVYFIIMWAGWGQTLGNRILRIAVIDVRSRPLNILQSMLRYSGLLASQIIFYAPLLFVLQPVYRQRIHDFISASVVVEVPDDIKEQIIRQREQMEEDVLREDDRDS